MEMDRSRYSDDLSDDSEDGILEAELAKGRAMQVAMGLGGCWLAHKARQDEGGLRGHDVGLLARVATLSLSCRAFAGIVGRSEWLLRPHIYPLAAFQIGCTALFPMFGHIITGMVAGWSLGGIVLPKLLVPTVVKGPPKDSPKESALADSFSSPPRSRQRVAKWQEMSPRMIDTTGDGVRDSVVVDTTGDGRFDTVIAVRQVSADSVGRSRTGSEAKVGKAMSTPSLQTDTASSVAPKTPPADSLGSGASGSDPFSVRSEIHIDELHLLKRIASGNSSTVYLGTWRGVEVAIKEMFVPAEMKIEAMRLQAVSHPNIVQCYGHSSYQGKIFLVMEYCNEGCLENYLRCMKQTNSRLIVSEFLEVARSVAFAMMSVHRDGYVHRDVAARNVFKAGGLYKLGDFGLVRELEGGLYRSSSADVPVGWTSPEALKTGLFSKKSDVWSYGVFLWEVLGYCQRTPYQNGQEKVVASDVERAVLSGELLERPEACPDSLWDALVRPCFNPPNSRPSFEEIATVTLPTLQACYSEASLQLFEEPMEPVSAFYSSISNLYGPSTTLCSSDII